MITIKEFPNKVFETQEEAIKELVANKKTLIAAKKGVVKHCDSLPYIGTLYNTKDEAVKNEDVSALNDINTIKIVAASNACNYFDSHGDVSLNGSWNRTAKNTKDGLHLQEHQMKFDKIISDNVTWSVETKAWTDLGFDFQGTTEVLIMTSIVEKETNPYMFDKYIKGKVKNHSSGLRYVNIDLAVNNSAEWAKEEKELWDKYYPSIVNKDDVDQCGYFWVIFEQKIIENSAVVRGSNPATPTITVEPADSTSTQNENSYKYTSQSETKQTVNLNLFI